MKKFVIAQLSDIHIPAKPEKIYNINVRENFLKILNSIKKSQINMIIITGDLSYRSGGLECYNWIKKHLDKTGINYMVTPGNHDNSFNMFNVFKSPAQIDDTKLYYSLKIENWKLLFLDSSDDIIDNRQLNWIEQQSYKCEKKIIIFMHHPPVLTGCKYMDRKYPLKNIKEFNSKIGKLNNIEHIFCGHYHNDKILSLPNFKIYMAPSTWYQINENSDKFSIKSYKIGWRKIILYKDFIETQVYYLK